MGGTPGPPAISRAAAAVAVVLRALGAAAAPLRLLREFIRFLDPRLGVGSADVWTLGTIVLRNLLLNWLVLVPLLAAAILTPPDPMSQIGLALPTIILYELSILAVRMIERSREREETVRAV